MSARSRPFGARRNFVYTDESQITGNPTLGASILDPTKHTTIHIEIKSHFERYIIKRAEPTAITLALEANRENPSHLYIDR